MYLMVPSVFTTTLPLAGFVRIVGLFNVPSISLSFKRTLMVTESSSFTLAVSSNASGASFTLSI